MAGRVKVTLLLYSGRENPSWDLQEGDLDRFNTLLSQKRDTAPSQSAEPKLGYQGFEVDIVEANPGAFSLPANFAVVSDTNIVAAGNLFLVDHDQELETFLYQSAVRAGVLDEPQRELVKTTMTKNASGGTLAPERGDALETAAAGPQPEGAVSLMTATAVEGPPPYEPWKWNDDPQVKRRNNCYNYGCNKITNTFAQPGRGSGQKFQTINCNDVGSAAERDGLVRQVGSSTPANGHLVALVIAPSADFHWYRLDSTGTWSHKPGQTAATNKDNSGNVIRDPERADRGPYTQFCGYFTCQTSKVTIQ